ncbi:MAG: putative RNA methyltransferase [Thermoleophilaceae bacterium]
MLSSALDLLRCPHCDGALACDNATVRCEAGHSFDVARQGYLSLLPGDAELGSADTAAMVSARSAFLGAGHFDPLAEEVQSECERAVAADAGGCVVDLGAGTGWYLARVLERVGDRTGLALDLSKHALRRAARAHPRIAAVACDAWRPLPLRDGVAALALSVFAPRNGPELARVLRSRGALVLASPTRAHLRELVPALGLLSVDERKPQRLAAQLDPYFDRLAQHGLDWTMELDHAGVRDLVGMGPSALHTDAGALEEAVAALAEPVCVTGSVSVSVYRRRD